MTRYVQHVSGQGKKWRLASTTYNDRAQHDWSVEGEFTEENHYLPKSEYRLCEPPERWREITESCQTVNRIGAEQGSMLEDQHVVIARIERGYRLRKVQFWRPLEQLDRIQRADWAFIVEQEEAP